MKIYLKYIKIIIKKMGKYISLGEYNKQYKYIWIYLIIRFIYLFVFPNQLMFDQIKTDVLNLPYGPFISSQFNYLVYILISAIIIIINKYRKKKERSNSLIKKNNIQCKYKKNAYY